MLQRESDDAPVNQSCEEPEAEQEVPEDPEYEYIKGPGGSIYQVPRGSAAKEAFREFQNSWLDFEAAKQKWVTQAGLAKLQS